MKKHPRVYRQKVSLIKNAIQIKKMSARIPICPSAGTFSGNPLTLSTGAATLKYLQENGDIYPDMMAKGKFLRNGFNEYCSSNGYPFCMTGIGSIFQIHAKAELPRIPRDLLGQDEDALGELQLYFRLNNILPPTPRRILKKC
jgi:glutamate-1-semialdehyde aminotransferase